MIPITEADGPQKFDDELEARLVKEGVAKYIGELGETAEQPAPAPGDDADEPASTNTAADEAPEYNEDMKLDELKEVAARYGVDASAMRRKPNVIAAIEPPRPSSLMTRRRRGAPSDRRRRSRLMAFSFKAMVEADRRRTFLNLDEFGEKHTVEGRAIAAVLDDNALKERQGGQELSVAESSLLLYAAVEDLPLGARRAKGSTSTAASTSSTTGARTWGSPPWPSARLSPCRRCPMSIVNSIETVRDWLTAEVCPLVKLKLPDDNATDASYPYKLVNPAAFSLFVPSKDRTPPNIAARSRRSACRLFRATTTCSRVPETSRSGSASQRGIPATRARHLQPKGDGQRHLHPAIQRGGGLLLREERRGLA